MIHRELSGVAYESSLHRIGRFPRAALLTLLALALLFLTCASAHAQSYGVPYLVRDINQATTVANPASPFASNVSNMVTVGNTLYFNATDANYGQLLWQTDGSMISPVLNHPMAYGDFDNDIIRLNGKFIVPGSTGALCISDGTPDGIQCVNQVKMDYSTYYNSYQYITIGNWLYFVGSDSTHGAELWKTDGTIAGTVLVKDINPGLASSNIYNLTVRNGILFFTCNDGTHGTELWKSDGTAAGTVLVRDITPGPDYSNVSNLVVKNGTLYFTYDYYVVDPGDQVRWINRRELWKCDGTAAGTVKVTNFDGSFFVSPAGNILTFPGSTTYLSEVNGTAFYLEYPDVWLWCSDGTPAGTRAVQALGADVLSGNNFRPLNVNGSLIFSVNTGDPDNPYPPTGYELWCSNGTSAGTFLINTSTSPILEDLAVGASLSAPGSFKGNLYYYVLNDTTGSYELWKTDGTRAGSHYVQSLHIYKRNASLITFFQLNGLLYYVASDSAHGAELWRTDGTPAGTALVKDVNPGSVDSNPQSLFTDGTNLYFIADDGVHGAELWRTDGTTAGTVLLKDVKPGAASSAPTSFASANGTLFFLADDGVHGQELWQSDGTPAGTALVKDIYVPPTGVLTAGSTPDQLTDMNGTLFFTADDGIHGRELWKSNAFSANTMLVKDVAPGSAASMPGDLKAVGNLCYFTADDGTHGRELWRSDGTAAGTLLLKDISPGAGDSNITQQTIVNGMLLFIADDGTHGRELWRTDGTPAGTILLKDITPGAGGSNLTQLTIVNNMLFFTFADGVSGMELWKTDGTPAGTTLVKDINPGPASSDPALLTNMNGTLFFSADDGVNGIELWKSDGTAAGTVLVKNIARGSSASTPLRLTVLGATLFFAANDGTAGLELWKSDGTAAGTVMVKDLFPGSSTSDPQMLTVVGSTLFFVADDGIHSRELWKSDGTAAGTVLVKDVYTPGNPGIDNMTAVGSTLFFTAGEAQHGFELWKSDGTAAGTFMLKDIFPGVGGAYPHDLIALNHGVVFLANSNDPGPDQLWRSDGTAAGTVAFEAKPSFFSVCAGEAFFFRTPFSYSVMELWHSDGSPAGTSCLQSFPAPWPWGSIPASITQSGKYLYCAMNGGGLGTELYALRYLSTTPAVPSPTPASLRFAADTPLAVDVELGGQPTSQVLTIKNTGDFPLTFSGGAPSTPGLKLTGRCAADFQIIQVTPATSDPLAPGATLTVTIRFAPTVTRRTLGLDAALAVTSDSSLTPSLSIPLLGDAVPVGLSSFRAE